MTAVAISITLLGGDTVTFLTLAAPLGVPAFVATFGLLANESSRQARDRQKHKERRYESMVQALESFYTDSSGENRGRFLAESELAWLYCGDDVIRATNRFLDAVEVGAQPSTDNERLVGQLMVEIRRDFLGKTRLTAGDFKHRSTTPGPA